MIKRYAVSGAIVSAALLVSVILQEGYTDHAVIPVPGDIPTIGPGRTGKDVHLGDKTTVPREMVFLLNNLETRYAAGIRECIRVPLAQYEFDALVDLAYNAGPRAVCAEIAPRFNNARTDEDYLEACSVIRTWRTTVNHNDCRDPKFNCRGLITRRQKEYEKCSGIPS